MSVSKNEAKIRLGGEYDRPPSSVSSHANDKPGHLKMRATILGFRLAEYQNSINLGNEILTINFPAPDSEESGFLELESKQEIDKDGIDKWADLAIVLLEDIRLVLELAGDKHLDIHIMSLYCDREYVCDYLRKPEDKEQSERIGKFPAVPLDWKNIEPLIKETSLKFRSTNDNKWGGIRMAIRLLLEQSEYDEILLSLKVAAIEALYQTFLSGKKHRVTRAKCPLTKEDCHLVQEVAVVLTLRQRILKFFHESGITCGLKVLGICIDIKEKEKNILDTLVRTRNAIIHRAAEGLHSQDKIKQSVKLAHEIAIQMIFSILDFEGEYYCSPKDGQLRTFPSCELADTTSPAN